MGFIIGSIFGTLLGTYSAITYRSYEICANSMFINIYVYRFTLIPMMALSSGGSFGFFMGVGMIMRSEMDEKDAKTDEIYFMRAYDPQTK